MSFRVKMNKPKCKTYSNGNKHWYLNDKRHREDGPACEYANGDKLWYLNGKCHREDGPAVEHSNGNKSWYLNNKEVNPETIVDLWLAKNIYCFYNAETGCLEFEQMNKPECKTDPNGNKRWYLNGKLHREDGPAVA